MSSVKENLEVLLAAVEAQPEELFSLNHYSRKTDCGTLFCTVGLACTMPYFQEKGLNLNNVGDARLNGESLVVSDDLDLIFGTLAFDNLFTVRRHGNQDHNHPMYDVNLASVKDKELAIWRLKRQLAIYSEAV